jgi:hypothetical protein
LLWAIDGTVEGRLRPSAPNSAGDRDADEQARRDAEEQARRDAEEQARRDAEDAEHQAHTDPQAGEERAVEAASSPPEVVEWGEPGPSGTARILSRRWAKILAATLAVGGLVVLIFYLGSARPFEAAIMSRLPDDLRASCTATDKTATCRLKDGTVVFYRLFDTVTKAKEDVINRQQIEPAGYRCPPAAPPPVNTTVVCHYATGPDKGLAMFSYTTKGTQRYYISRWVPDAEPLLQGEMSTKTANPQDWTALVDNWEKLVKAT